MSSKKLNQENEKGFLSGVLQYLLSFPRYYLIIRMMGVIILLLAIVFAGDVFSKNGLLLVLGALGYILLIVLSSWYEKQ